MKPIKTDGWLTVEDMDLGGHLPVSLFDANGCEVLRAVVAFNPTTGDVKSNILKRDGRPILNDAKGEVYRRIERFPAPLIWKSITPAEAKKTIARYWDLKEDN